MEDPRPEGQEETDRRREGQGGEQPRPKEEPSVVITGIWPGVLKSFRFRLPGLATAQRVRHQGPYVIRYRQAGRIERTIFVEGEERPRVCVEEIEADKPYYRPAGTDHIVRNLTSMALDGDKDEIQCPVEEDLGPSVPETRLEEKKGRPSARANRTRKTAATKRTAKPAGRR